MGVGEGAGTGELEKGMVPLFWGKHKAPGMALQVVWEY